MAETAPQGARAELDPAVAARMAEAHRPRNLKFDAACLDCGGAISARRRADNPLTVRCEQCGELAAEIYRSKAWMPPAP